MAALSSLRCWAALSLLAALACPPPCAAQDIEVEQSKGFFKAGAAAYEMGDYLAAIQALDAAYRITPLPAIAFSLAQAERRQYFVSHARTHLERAIELFQIYLRQVPTGGRRSDATDALGQLEPLAGNTAAVSGTTGGPVMGERTRLMVSCDAPGVQISLDAEAPHHSPLIAQVEPGNHRLRVIAPGYDTDERDIVAIPGELVPLWVTLRERPVSVTLSSEPRADVHVDGSFVGRIEDSRRFQLPSGLHIFSFSANGHELQQFESRLAPGGQQTIKASLEPTGQRTTAVALFIAAGASVVTGVVLGGLALDRESDASDVLTKRMQRSLSPGDLDDYSDAKRDRNLFRASAIVSFATAAAALVTGLLLYGFDQSDIGDAPLDKRVQLSRLRARPTSGRSGLQLQLSF